MYLAAPLCFYSLNDVTLNKKKILRCLGETTKAHKDRAYTTEEISALLGCADVRLRSIILILASCGSRIGALPQLKVSNLTPIPDYDLYRVTLYENAKEECLVLQPPKPKGYRRVFRLSSKIWRENNSKLTIIRWEEVIENQDNGRYKCKLIKKFNDMFLN